MNKNAGLRILLLGNIIITLFLAACGTSPPAKFYTLSSMPLEKPNEKAAPSEKNTVIAIGPIEIPEYLDRMEIVARADNNRLNISEFDLWGGSLKTDISRVLVENIGILLDGDGLAVIPWKTSMTGSYRVPVIINRLDGIPGDTLTLKAQWSLVDKDEKTPLTFREIIRAKPIKGSTYSAIVASMSEALADLSKSIAESIKSKKDALLH